MVPAGKATTGVGGEGGEVRYERCIMADVGAVVSSHTPQQDLGWRECSGE